MGVSLPNSPKYVTQVGHSIPKNYKQNLFGLDQPGSEHLTLKRTPSKINGPKFGIQTRLDGAAHEPEHENGQMNFQVSVLRGLSLSKSPKT